MAKRSPTGNDNRLSMDKFAFRTDDATGEWWRAVADELTHDKLDAIVNALGGSSNTTATIYNQNIISAGVEQSLVLPANTKRFLIKSRNRGQLKLAYVFGGTDITFLTIPVGTSFVDANFYQAQTIFFQSNKPGDVIEIVAYT